MLGSAIFGAFYFVLSSAIDDYNILNESHMNVTIRNENDASVEIVLNKYGSEIYLGTGTALSMVSDGESPIVELIGNNDYILSIDFDIPFNISSVSVLASYAIEKWEFQDTMKYSNIYTPTTETIDEDNEYFIDIVGDAMGFSGQFVAATERKITFNIGDVPYMVTTHLDIEFQDCNGIDRLRVVGKPADTPNPTTSPTHLPSTVNPPQAHEIEFDQIEGQTKQ